MYRARGVLATAALAGNALAERESIALLDDEGTSTKTLTLDVQAPEEMGFVKRSSEGVRARVDLVRAYLPAGGAPRPSSGRLLPR